jgi:hypothetical protein
MPGGKVGRPRKSTKQKVIEGTFRHDRDGGRADIDFPIIENTSAIKAPASIKNKEVRNHFEMLVKNLLKVQSLTWQDMASLEQAHLQLEKCYILQKMITSMETNGIGDQISDYTGLLAAQKRALEAYTSIVYRFGVSPLERSRITKKAVIENGKSKLAEILLAAK